MFRALVFSILVLQCAAQEDDVPIGEYTMELLEDVDDSSLVTGTSLYMAGYPNDTNSQYEVQLTVDKTTGLRIQYQFERNGNGTFIPQDVIRFGTNMTDDMMNSGTVFYSPRTKPMGDIRQEQHRMFIRLTPEGYVVNLAIGTESNNVYTYPYTFPTSSITKVGLRGQLKLRTYMRWKAPLSLPTVYKFPTESNIFPQGEKLCLVADLADGTNLTIQIMTDKPNVVAFQWVIDYVNGSYSVNNNLQGNWSDPKTATDCNVAKIPWKENEMAVVTLTNQPTCIDVDVQVGNNNYSCSNFFTHDANVNQNVGYREISADGDVDILHVSRINVL